MKQEEKQLLLQDLCARLPYGVRIMFSSNGFRWDWEQTLDEIRQCEDGEYAINGWGIHGIKPYLRPMSSMTEEEKKEFYTFQYKFTLQTHEYQELNKETFSEYLDWLNKKMFDYRDLIPKGLALEAPDGMYNNKEE